MSFEFRPAKREAIPLLLGVAGGTGSGKTLSALRMARGIAQGGPFAFIDTENDRGLHYADLFPEMQHARITAPFRPEKYAEAIEAGDKQGFKVIVVDSASHEWAGDGGCLDWHDELMGTDQSKNLSAWIKPKREHKKMVTRLLQVKAHVILCFRAEPKVEAVRKNGRVEIVPKASLTGLDGWLPISERMLPYELTASFLLMADKPGVPRPIKLQEQHRAFVPLDEPLSEQTGAALAAWAAGSSTSSGPVAVSVEDAAHRPPVAATVGPGGLLAQPAGPDQPLGSVTGAVEGRTPPPVPAGDARGGPSQPSDPDVLAAELLALADARGKKRAVQAAIDKNHAAHPDDPAARARWLSVQLTRARAVAAADDPDADIPQFQIPESART